VKDQTALAKVAVSPPGNVAPAPAALAASGSSENAPDAMPSLGDVRATDSVATSMIIRTGQASIQVDSLDAGVVRVRQLAQRVGGFIANTSVQAGRDQVHSATLEIKLPATHFDDAVSGLAPIGKLESVNVSAEDVGEEYVDVSARVANAHRLEQRLIDILDRRTGKLSDVLAVERELARVREEIERYEGRLRYLRSRTALSTLAVTVHEPFPVVGQTGSGSALGEAVHQAWRNFIGFIAGLIAALGTLLPLAVVLGALAWLGWRLRGRFVRTPKPE
jgi:hypothetical protein